MEEIFGLSLHIIFGSLISLLVLLSPVTQSSQRVWELYLTHWKEDKCNMNGSNEHFIPTEWNEWIHMWTMLPKWRQQGIWEQRQSVCLLQHSRCFLLPYIGKDTYAGLFSQYTTLIPMYCYTTERSAIYEVSKTHCFIHEMEGSLICELNDSPLQFIISAMPLPKTRNWWESLCNSWKRWCFCPVHKLSKLA